LDAKIAVGRRRQVEQAVGRRDAGFERIVARRDQAARQLDPGGRQGILEAEPALGGRTEAVRPFDEADHPVPLLDQISGRLAHASRSFDATIWSGSSSSAEPIRA
jgi:hypothetical protein